MRPAAPAVAENVCSTSVQAVCVYECMPRCHAEMDGQWHGCVGRLRRRCLLSAPAVAENVCSTLVQQYVGQRRQRVCMRAGWACLPVLSAAVQRGWGHACKRWSVIARLIHAMGRAVHRNVCREKLGCRTGPACSMYLPLSFPAASPPSLKSCACRLQMTECYNYPPFAPKCGLIIALRGRVYYIDRGSGSSAGRSEDQKNEGSAVWQRRWQVIRQ